MIYCDFCNKLFHKKPSEISKNNFCSRKCMGDFYRSQNTLEKYINKLTKSIWTNINIRCGKYRRNTRKNKAYINITVSITRDELKDFIRNDIENIRKLKRPSIDRIDSSKNYSLDNIQIIELSDNVIKKRNGNSYNNGPKSNSLRGVKKEKDFYSARITIFRQEIYLGYFYKIEDAYLCFYNTYFEFFGKEPFDKKLINGV